MFQTDIPTRHTTTCEAAAAEPEFLPLVHQMLEVVREHQLDSAAAVVPAAMLPAFADGHASVLLVALVERAGASVAAILEGDVDVYNEVSDDLLSSVTLLSLSAGENELRLATSRLIATALDYEKESLAVVVVAGDSVWRRHFVPHDLEDFCCTLQAAEISSGENYRPYRIYSDQELSEAAAIAKEPRIETATVYTPVPLTYVANNTNEQVAS